MKFAPLDTFSRLRMVSLGDAVGIALGRRAIAELGGGLRQPPVQHMVMGRSCDLSIKPSSSFLATCRHRRPDRAV